MDICIATAVYFYVFTYCLFYSIVVILNERTIILNVTTSDTVKKVKEKIQNEIGVYAEKLTLLHNGDQLQEDQLITYYDVNSKSLLQTKLGTYSLSSKCTFLSFIL